MGFLGWFHGVVPPQYEIKQVYGVLFNNDERILLLVDGENFSLPGGHPESIDRNMEDTLTREVFEEVNISIKNPVLLGYQAVDEEDGTPVFAQVRISAVINKIGKTKPDIANGKTYKRLLTTPENAIKLLNWGEIGEKMIKSAVNAARDQHYIQLINKNDEFI